MEAGDLRRYYDESFYFLNARKLRQVDQIVLLNNLNRGNENIASTLLLTLFNRMVSQAYDDKIQVKFLPSQDINQEQLDAYNVLAQSDYQEMGKAKSDYDWVWDTLFFGRGYCETLNFDKKRKIMQPHIINPLMMFYDPYMEDPQQWRYYGKWITKTKYELMKLIDKGYLNIDSTDKLQSGIDPYIWTYKIKRDQAKKIVQPPIQPTASDVFQIFEMFAYNEKGEKCVYWLDKNFSIILLEDKLNLKDGEPIVLPTGEMVDGISRWPVVVKESFREPHSSVNFSVADVLEDKHRAKSVLLNLAYIAAKDTANPLYWYDVDKIKDVTQFLSRQVNQHIPVEGDGNLAVGPINKAQPMTPELTAFISMLTQEANDPMGTGQVLQPSSSKSKQTATQSAIDQQNNDQAQSLMSKVMQFGEKEFWSHWFARYAKFGVGEKMANIVGVRGIQTTKIDLGLFNVKFPPQVQVYSAKEAEYRELVERRDLMQMYPAFAQTFDPDGMRNFNKHVFMPKFLKDPSLIDVVFPKTVDEMTAESENETLSKGEYVEARPTDNHTTHIYTHMMLQPKTWACWVHIKQHQDLLAEQMAQQQMAQAAEMTQTGPQKQSPLESAAPLKQESEKSNQTQKVKPINNMNENE